MDEYIRIGVTVMLIEMLAVAVMLPVVIIVVVVQFTRLLRSPGGPEFLASLSTPEGAANLSRMQEVERRQQEVMRQQEMFDRQHPGTYHGLHFIPPADGSVGPGPDFPPGSGF